MRRVARVARRATARRATSSVAVCRVAVVLLALAAVPARASSAGAASHTSTRRPASSALSLDAHDAVGVVPMTFTDPTRVTPANGGFPGHAGRVLSTWIYYPAVGSPGATVAVGAPPNRTGAPYPFIVFAHGFGADPRLSSYTTLLERWASAGFVVAAPVFPLTNSSAPGGADLSDYVNQPADVSFVISSVINASSQPGGPLSALVDTNEVGAAGHSLGGVTVLGLASNTCCEDRRVRAAVVMAGDQISFPRGTSDARAAPPILFVHGTADESVPYSAGVEAFNSAIPPKGLLSIFRGGHDAPVDPAGRGFGAVVRTTTDFFDRYLKGQPIGNASLFSDGRSSSTALTFVSNRAQHVVLAVPKTTVRHRQATVSPARNLVDGQIVRVTWRGYTPGISVNVLECGVPRPTQASDCDLQTAKLLQADPRGSGSVALAVHTGAIGSHVCDPIHRGCVIAVNEGGSLVPSATVEAPISFAA